MTEENSFDPRSWSKADAKKAALPEAWRIASWQTETSGSLPLPERKAVGNLWKILVPVALIAAGGAAYWAMKGPSAKTESVAQASPDAGNRVEPSGTQPVASSRRLVIANPGDLHSALVAAGLPQADADAVSKAALGVLGAAKGEIQAVMNLVTEGSSIRLDRLEASLPDGSGAVVSRSEPGEWKVSRVAAELSKQIKVVRGEMDTNSFYSSAVSAGVVDSLIPEFINAFAFDFDLQQEVAPGDRFEVAYEQTVNAEGQPVGQPQLLFAALITEAKSRALYRFKPAGQEVGWYDGNAGSTVRSFMRTPVDGARISSKFGYRLHPVLGYMKLHRGTDFAAPTGTPIYASGDASVEWAAMKGANGNLTILRHDNGWQTFYLHQSMFMPGIAPGVRVRQGQKIGEVGTTGRSTGPHLHYEVHIDGQAVDPQSIKTESGRSGLEGGDRSAFLQQRDRVDVARARQAE
jgi:murein DD-endopeptidase MepM/ murein hydrolase activator NlpD